MEEDQRDAIQSRCFSFFFFFFLSFFLGNRLPTDDTAGEAAAMEVVSPPQCWSLFHEDGGLFTPLFRPPSAVLNSSPATNTDTHTHTQPHTHCTGYILYSVLQMRCQGRDCGLDHKQTSAHSLKRKFNVYFYSYGLAISCLYLPSCHCFNFQLTCTACHDFVKPLPFLDHFYSMLSVFMMRRLTRRPRVCRHAIIGIISVSPLNLLFQTRHPQFAFVRLFRAGKPNRCFRWAIMYIDFYNADKGKLIVVCVYSP